MSASCAACPRCRTSPEPPPPATPTARQAAAPGRNGWPATPTSPGSCSGPPGRSWTPDAPPAPSPRRSAARSSPVTGTASGLAATHPQDGATRTTSPTGPTVDRPQSKTEPCYAVGITIGSTSTATRSSPPRAVLTSSTPSPTPTQTGTPKANSDRRGVHSGPSSQTSRRGRQSH